jgi:hypothetical protein
MNNTAMSEMIPSVTVKTMTLKGTMSASDAPIALISAPRLKMLAADIATSTK